MNANELRIQEERRIVRGLIRHMRRAGWRVVRVDDGEDCPKVRTEEQAMAAVFAVDDARLVFGKGDHKHGVLLIGGNGEDIISDWSYFAGDADGFNAAMEAYDIDAPEPR